MKKFKQLHHELSVAPLTLSVNFSGYASPQLARLLKIKKLPAIFLFRGNAMWFYTRESVWDGSGKNIISRAKRDIIPFRQQMASNEIFKKRLLALVQDFNFKKFQHLKPKQSAKFLGNIFDLSFKFCLPSELAVISDHNHETLSHSLETAVKRAVKNSGKKYKSSSLLSDLTAPIWPYPSDAAASELLQIKRKTGFNQSQVKRQLTRYIRRWHWLNFGHLGKSASVKNIYQDLKTLSEESVLMKLDVQSRQKELLNSMKFSQAEKNLLEVSRIFIYEKGIRLEVCNGVYALIHKILEKISLQTDLKKADLLFCSPKEIVNYFYSKPLPPLDELRQRQKASVWTGSHPLKLSILSGQKAEEFVKKNLFQPSRVLKDVSEIRGSVAYPGKVKGRVRIVNRPSDVGKVKPGDILVAIATTPELLPAMKKSAAIVTDVGGIASHAAIVAREMKKPCVVGTKFATHVLKDGDLVEVDAMHGVVRKIP